ncbi:hypothetical protein LTR95_014024, partial [Oleoguttula sp. CCFEE 5521]
LLAFHTDLTAESQVSGPLNMDDIPLAVPATSPHFLRIPVELRTLIYKQVLTHPCTGIHFVKNRVGVQGHAYNAAVDPIAQTSSSDPFTMMTERRWHPESRANGILGYYETLTALLCVKKQFHEETSPLFYANHFVFGSITALDKFLRKQAKAVVFQGATNDQLATTFSPPITSLRNLTIDYPSQGKAAAKHAFRYFSLATSLQNLTVRIDRMNWMHFRQGGKTKYNYPRQYEGLRELCDSLISMPLFRKLEIVGDCEDIAVWIGVETYKGRSDGSRGWRIGYDRFVEVWYDGAMVSPKGPVEVAEDANDDQ